MPIWLKARVLTWIRLTGAVRTYKTKINTLLPLLTFCNLSVKIGLTNTSWNVDNIGQNCWHFRCPCLRGSDVATTFEPKQNWNRCITNACTLRADRFLGRYVPTYVVNGACFWRAAALVLTTRHSISRVNNNFSSECWVSLWTAPSVIIVSTCFPRAYSHLVDK